MNEETKVLLKALDHAHAKIGALEAMVHLLAGMEAQRNPMIVALLKRTAAGDAPDLVPDGPALPPNVTRDERQYMEAKLAEHRRATKHATMELANQIAGFIERANREPG
jgi:hypothetical protein